MNTKTKVAVLGSGKGSNADALCVAQRGGVSYQIAAIIGTRAGQGILDVAAEHHVPSFVVEWTGDEETDARSLIAVLEKCGADMLVLAGFLRKLPTAVITYLGGSVINIHPALLPKFGGKGMFGIRVHQAVLDACESESGATVHWVTDRYDEGSVVLQGTVIVYPEDTPETLRDRVKSLEHRLLPRALDLVCTRTTENSNET